MVSGGSDCGGVDLLVIAIKQTGTGRKCKDSFEEIAVIICLCSVVIVGLFSIFAKDQPLHVAPTDLRCSRVPSRTVI